jgi:hypothetical protein
MPEDTKTTSAMEAESPKAPGRLRPRRTLPWLIAGVSLIALIVSSVLLAQRVRAYNESSVNSVFAFIEVNNPEFEFFGRPVSLTETEDTEGRHAVLITYGDDELKVAVTVEPRRNLPGFFNRHADWLRMVFFADRSGLSMDEFEARMNRDEIETRLVVVTRTPYGADPDEPGLFGLEQERNESTADVRRDQWRFDFYELEPDGGLTVHQPLRFPESGKSLLRRQNQAKLAGEPIPQRDPGEIVERTWQYGAALKVMPRAPAITFENQALRAAGWTLPVASGSVLGLVFGVFFAIAPARTKA